MMIMLSESVNFLNNVGADLKQMENRLEAIRPNCKDQIDREDFIEAEIAITAMRNTLNETMRSIAERHKLHY